VARRPHGDGPEGNPTMKNSIHLCNKSITNPNDIGLNNPKCSINQIFFNFVLNDGMFLSLQRRQDRRAMVLAGV
jgi:hypothetical protein